MFFYITHVAIIRNLCTLELSGILYYKWTHSMGPHVGVGARIPRNEVLGEKMVRGKLAQVGGLEAYLYQNTSICWCLLAGKSFLYDIIL